MNKILDKISGSRAPSPPKVFDHLLLTSPRNNFREYLQMHENSIFGYCYFLFEDKFFVIAHRCTRFTLQEI